MEKTHIFFDLETTGLGKDCDIVQIAAVHENGKTFNRYIIPEVDIEEDATKINGITKVNVVTDTDVNGIPKVKGELRKKVAHFIRPSSRTMG
jgi:DNA polymerase III epsilon subunit-like protein